MEHWCWTEESPGNTSPAHCYIQTDRHYIHLTSSATDKWQLLHKLFTSQMITYKYRIDRIDTAVAHSSLSLTTDSRSQSCLRRLLNVLHVITYLRPTEHITSTSLSSRRPSSTEINQSQQANVHVFDRHFFENLTVVHVPHGLVVPDLWC